MSSTRGLSPRALSHVCLGLFWFCSLIWRRRGSMRPRTESSTLPRKSLPEHTLPGKSLPGHTHFQGSLPQASKAHTPRGVSPKLPKHRLTRESLRGFQSTDSQGSLYQGPRREVLRLLWRGVSTRAHDGKSLGCCGERSLPSQRRFVNSTFLWFSYVFLCFLWFSEVFHGFL